MATPTDVFLCALLLLFCCDFSSAQSSQHPFILVEIQKTEYQQMVDSGEHFLVNFGTVGCIRCKELEPEYQLVFDKFVRDSTIKVVKMNDINIVRKLGLVRVPSILLFRHGVPIVYEGTMVAADIIYWVEQNFESFTTKLIDEDFEHLTQSSTGSTTGDWMVMFHKPDVARGAGLIPIWESVAYKLKGKINVAKVNLNENPKLEKRFRIEEKDVPAIIFFRNSKQYAYTISQRDSKSLITFAEIGYKHAQGVDVMTPPSPFDELTESIALQMKGLLSDSGSSTVLISGLVFILAVVGILVCLCRGGGATLQEMTSSNTKKSV